MLTIRGHHLLCILTFVGRGYTPDFTRRMAEVVRRIGAGEAFTITFRPDSICAGWREDPHCHCHKKSLFWRDLAGIIATGIVLRRFIWSGHVLQLSPGQIAAMRRAFKRGHSRLACKTCQWQGFCSEVAASDFKNSILRI